MATHTLNKTRTTTWTINKSGDTWIVGEKGKIISNDTHGIFHQDANGSATIRVDGAIDMANGYGITTLSKNIRINIGETGHISSGDPQKGAIYCANPAGTVKIDNDGLLEGYIGLAVVGKQDGITVRNDGRIIADSVGGYVGNGLDADIINAGTIRSGLYGLAFESGGGAALDAENAARVVNSGKIIGAEAAIAAGNGAVNIRNKGLLDGNIRLDDGYDVINNRGGTINGDIYGGSGNDVFNMAGGKLNGVLYGGMGSDVVTLSSPATVYVEYSGEGDDTVRINGSYQLGGNIDNLTLLGKGNHTGIGNSLDNDIFGNKGNNALYGAGGGDDLLGKTGNDRLFGGDGGDRLDGGRGADILTGGAGADDFYFQPGFGHDTITDFQDGIDRLYFDGSAFGGESNILNLVKQSGDDVVIDFGNGDRIVIEDMLASKITDQDIYYSS